MTTYTLVRLLSIGSKRSLLVLVELFHAQMELINIDLFYLLQLSCFGNEIQ